MTRFAFGNANIVGLVRNRGDGGHPGSPYPSDEPRPTPPPHPAIPDAE